MKLHTYMNEIWDIARVNDKPVAIGADMFMVNVRDGKSTYPGAPGIDFAALRPHLKALEASRDEYNAAIHKHYYAICLLRQEGKRKEAAALVAV